MVHPEHPFVRAVTLKRYVPLSCASNGQTEHVLGLFLMHEQLLDLGIATVRVPLTTSASGETQDFGEVNDVVMVEAWRKLDDTRPVQLGS